MDKAKQEAIKGYNEEKQALSEMLSRLSMNNHGVITRISIEGRLREIDEQIRHILSTSMNKKKL